MSYRRLNRCAGILSLDEFMFGCVQLVLGCVEQCCFFAMGCNLNRHHRCSMTQMHTAAATTTTAAADHQYATMAARTGTPRWPGSDAARRTTAAACIHANSAWTPGINAMDTVWEQAVSSRRRRRRPGKQHSLSFVAASNALIMKKEIDP